MSATFPLVTLYLSERCNSRCNSCDYWRHGSADMTLDDVRAMLTDLATLGTGNILISGGEPLLNREWPAIAELLTSRGLSLWLLTSGLSLRKEASRVARLFESVTVSLDGSCPETYAAIRGVDAFEQVCEGIRAAVAAGVPTGLRVTLQQANFRELPQFVKLAHTLGVTQISFLAIDVSNRHAFARTGAIAPNQAPNPEEIEELGAQIDRLEVEHAADFESGFIAESPARLRRIRDYFAALCGLGEFPSVRCNAPQFSAVVGASGRVSPCFFIPGPPVGPRAPELVEALHSAPMRALRTAIQNGDRPECLTCVCPKWRDDRNLADAQFRLDKLGHA